MIGDVDSNALYLRSLNNPKSMKTIFATLALFVFISFGAVAQQQTADINEVSKAQVAKIMELTDLDEDQEVLLYRQIYTQNDNMIRLEKMKASEEDKAAMAAEQTKRYYEAVKNILTEDQFTAFMQVQKQEEKKAAKKK
jgi:tRNA G10  N-methylase Trm11